MCASMKSPTSSFAVALYDPLYDPPDAPARSCSFGRSRTRGLGRVSVPARRAHCRQRPETARDSVRLLSRRRRESRRTASDDTAPICPSPPTRSARWTTTRRPPRRRRKSRRETPSQRRKVRATRRVSVLRWGDEKSRETNARRRGDDIKNARHEWWKTFVSVSARGAIEPTARGATPGAESPSDEW